MNESIKEGKPFFVQLSHYATHLSLVSKKETYQYFKNKPIGKRHTNPEFAAMLKDMDTCIGKIIDFIKEAGIEDNTYIFLMGDNGGVSTDDENPGGYPVLCLCGCSKACHDNTIKQPNAKYTARRIRHDVIDIRRPAWYKMLVKFVQHAIDRHHDNGKPGLERSITIRCGFHGAQCEKTEYPENEDME